MRPPDNININHRQEAGGMKKSPTLVSAGTGWSRTGCEDASHEWRRFSAPDLRTGLITHSALGDVSLLNNWDLCIMWLGGQAVLEVKVWGGGFRSPVKTLMKEIQRCAGEWEGSFTSRTDVLKVTYYSISPTSPSDWPIDIHFLTAQFSSYQQQLHKHHDQQLSSACDWTGGCMGWKSIWQLHFLFASAQTLTASDVLGRSQRQYFGYWGLTLVQLEDVVS